MTKSFKQAKQDLQNAIGSLERQANQPRLAEVTRNKILLRIEIQKESIEYFEKGYKFAMREVKNQKKLSQDQEEPLEEEKGEQTTIENI